MHGNMLFSSEKTFFLCTDSNLSNQFKEVNKVGLESSLYQPGGSLGSSYPPGLTPIVHPPTSTFAPPSHLSSVPPKVSFFLG